MCTKDTQTPRLPSPLGMEITYGPTRLASIAFIPHDTTSWDSIDTDPYVNLGAGKGVTPNRSRGMPLSRALTPRNATTLPESGLYVLGAGDPTQGIPLAFYVGISGVGAKETIFSRVTKHRVKLTGSHVGTRFPATSNGGIHHPGAWRDYAIERYRWHTQSNINDVCEDVWIMVLGFDDGSATKATLEFVEDRIFNDEKIKQAIIDALWAQTGSTAADKPVFLTSRTSRGIRPSSGVKLTIGSQTYPL